MLPAYQDAKVKAPVTLRVFHATIHVVPLDRKAFLADPELLRTLGAHVRSRVPPADAEDVLQTVLADALVATTAPDDAEALRKWLFGMARNKVADFYRKRRREEPTPDATEGPAPSSGRAAGRDMLEWAEKELPPGSEAKRTFEWMLREGEGEKLESIAASERLPAPRVRKRVSRMREHFRSRWAAYTAALIAGITILVAIYVLRRKPEPEAHIVPESPLEMARKERARALEACDHAQWQPCLDGLDRAAAADPAGDRDPRVVQARDAAHKALTPTPSPTPTPTPTPTPSLTPTPLPTPTLAPTPRPRPTSMTPTHGSSL